MLNMLLYVLPKKSLTIDSREVHVSKKDFYTFYTIIGSSIKDCNIFLLKKGAHLTICYAIYT